jgi:hypothetical protein
MLLPERDRFATVPRGCNNGHVLLSGDGRRQPFKDQRMIVGDEQANLLAFSRLRLPSATSNGDMGFHPVPDRLYVRSERSRLNGTRAQAGVAGSRYLLELNAPAAHGLPPEAGAAWDSARQRYDKWLPLYFHDTNSGEIVAVTLITIFLISAPGAGVQDETTSKEPHA